MDNVTDELRLLRLEEAVQARNPIVQRGAERSPHQTIAVPKQMLRRNASWRSDPYRSEGSSDERAPSTTPRARSTSAAASGEVRGVNIAWYAPGLCMLDTGCVEAVGGEQWHADLQAALYSLGKAYWREDMSESFQFGLGIPLHATTRWMYPEVAILGCPKSLKMVSVPADIPGLVGPSEMALWKLSMQFGGERGDEFSVCHADDLKTSPIT